jgi:hypothetical protein
MMGDMVQWTKRGMRGTSRCRIVASRNYRAGYYVVQVLGHGWHSQSPRIGERHVVSEKQLHHSAETVRH